jgi:hypothetical protein
VLLQRQVCLRQEPRKLHGAEFHALAYAAASHPPELAWPLAEPTGVPVERADARQAWQPLELEEEKLLAPRQAERLPALE